MVALRVEEPEKGKSRFEHGHAGEHTEVMRRPMEMVCCARVMLPVWMRLTV